jgi:WD40 repeat protein
LWHFDGANTVPNCVLSDNPPEAVLWAVRVAGNGQALLVVHRQPPPAWQLIGGELVRMPPLNFLLHPEQPPHRYNFLRIWNLSGETATPGPFLLTDDTDAFFAPDGRVITLGNAAVHFWDPAQWPRPADDADQPGLLERVPWFVWIGVGCLIIGIVVMYRLDPFPQRGLTILDFEQVRRTRREKYWWWVSGSAGVVVIGLLATWYFLPANDAPTPVATVWAEVDGTTTSAALAPDGRCLALAAAKGIIRLYRLGLDESQEPAVLKGHDGDVASLAFSADGKLLASAGEDGTVRLWEMGEALCERAVLRAHRRRVQSVSFTADGRSLVSGSWDGTVRIWDLTGAEAREKLPYHVGIAVLLGAGETLAETCTQPNTLRLWDLTGGRPVPMKTSLPGYEKDVLDVQLSPDKRLLATLEQSVARTPDNLDAQIHEDFQHIKMGLKPKSPRPPQESQYVLRLWDLSEAVPRQRFVHTSVWDTRGTAQYTQAMRLLAFAPSGRVLAAPGKDRGVCLWDLTADPPTGTALPGKCGWLESMDFSPDGKMLAARMPRNVLLWDLRQPVPDCRVLPFDDCDPSAFLDGTTLAVHKTFINRVEFYDGGGKGQPVGKALVPDFSEPAYRALFTRLSLTWSRIVNGIRVHFATREGMMEWKWAAPGQVYRTCVAPDCRHVVTVNGDGTIYIVRLWDPAATKRLLHSAEEVLKCDPRNVEALVTRGRVRLAKKLQLAAARADADAALKIDGEHAGAMRLRVLTLYRLGRQCAAEGKYGEARAHLAEAVRLDPTLATSPPPGHWDSVPAL